MCDIRISAKPINYTYAQRHSSYYGCYVRTHKINDTFLTWPMCARIRISSRTTEYPGYLGFHHKLLIVAETRLGECRGRTHLTKSHSFLHFASDFKFQNKTNQTQKVGSFWISSSAHCCQGKGSTAERSAASISGCISGSE